MRLTAFIMATTHSTVSGTPMSEPSERIPCPGNQKYRSCTPSSTRMPAARTWPAAFTPGDVPRTSSYTPINMITSPASSAATGSDDEWCSSEKNGSTRDTAIPTSTPR